VTLVAAVNLMPVPASAVARGTPVIGGTTVVFATAVMVNVDAVPATVKLTTAVCAPAFALDITICQMRIDCPADDATISAGPAC
jgi:hypothetical protein